MEKGGYEVIGGAYVEDSDVKFNIEKPEGSQSGVGYSLAVIYRSSYEGIFQVDEVCD